MDKTDLMLTIRAREVKDRYHIFSYDVASQLDSEYILKI